MSSTALSAGARTKPEPTVVARERDGFGLFAKFVAVGFWGTLASLIVAACAVPGFAVLALLPLLGLPYLLFCFIALAGDRDVG